eukprot:4793879-Pleurochrysis_carterae.AAC.2
MHRQKGRADDTGAEAFCALSSSRVTPHSALLAAVIDACGRGVGAERAVRVGATRARGGGGRVRMWTNGRMRAGVR